jgi:hypothetical protein
MQELHMRAMTRTFLIAAAVPSLLAAQSVVVQSNADTRFFGALGTIANAAARLGGGDMHNMPSTTYVSGHKMKVESANSATILDADAGRVTSIDMKQKTYTSMTFADMAAAMQQAQASARQQMKTQQAKAPPPPPKDPTAPQTDVNVKYQVVVDRPGQHQKIAGYDAERVFVTITLQGDATQQGQKPEDVGSMVFLMDEWMSKDAPQIAAIREFQREYAAKAGDTFREPTQNLQAAFASDPRIKDGFTAAAKEMSKVQGIPLRSVTYVSLVPPNTTFDRGMVLGDASTQAAADSAAKKDDKPKQGGLRGMFGALKSAAEDASKNSDKNSGQPPKQANMMSVTTEVTNISTGPVPPGTFDIPAGFREIKITMPPGN